jgi:hypothetical protein
MDTIANFSTEQRSVQIFADIKREENIDDHLLLA